MSVQVWIRAVVMALAAAVILTVGGRAAVDAAWSGADARPAAATVAPTHRAAVAVPTPAVTPPAPVVPAGVPTSLSVREARAVRGHRVTLRAVLTERLSGRRLRGRVTLWRKDPHGRWTALDTGRPTTPAGLVQVTVTQPAARGVYRLTFAPDGVHAACASRTVTVARR